MASCRSFGLILWLCLAALNAKAEENLVDVITKVKASVVAIGTYSKLRSPSFIMRGTGFAIGDGTLIATAAHVLAEPVNYNEGEELVAMISSSPQSGIGRPMKLLATDQVHDTAVLKLSGASLPALALRRDEKLVSEGTEVVFTGFPIGTVLGVVPVSHRGMVSAITPVVLPTGNARTLKSQMIERVRKGVFDVYQLDGTAYPGNSGGPLIDRATGDVIGVINMVFVKGTKEAALTQPSGISFAIPSTYISALLK